jgi:hypothetical protein
MKKLLLSSAAVCGLVMAAAPAHAQVELDIGGYFKGYGAYVDQDEDSTTDFDAGEPGVQAGEVNDFDMIRDTEIHFTGETTLDNGLTVGAHFETDADGGDSLDVDESYAYFTGNWGRVNLGDEDGAAYLLQVAAPSADENIDGIRQFVQPVNYSRLANLGVTSFEAEFDYDQDVSGKDSKLTYMTPIFSGFQAGASFTPDTGGAADDLEGIGADNEIGEFGATYEIGARYEGQFDMVGVIVGAGYSMSELEAEDATPAVGDVTDDRAAWNVGLDLNIGAFGIGAAYTEDDLGEEALAVGTGDGEETFVVGVDYTTGPFKLGASYFNQDYSLGTDGLETDRYSGGVTYTYGPGMTFRGSVGYIEHDASVNLFGTDDETDATYVTVGTQINF